MQGQLLLTNYRLVFISDRKCSRDAAQYHPTSGRLVKAASEVSS
jgi:hypothetical protein